MCELYSNQPLRFVEELGRLKGHKRAEGDNVSNPGKKTPRLNLKLLRRGASGRKGSPGVL